MSRRSGGLPVALPLPWLNLQRLTWWGSQTGQLRARTEVSEGTST